MTAHRGWIFRRSIGAWSLRARVLAAVVVLTSAGILATGAAATILLRRYLVGQIDGQLAVGAAAATRIGAAVGPRPPGPALHPNPSQQLPTPLVLTQLDRPARSSGSSVARSIRTAHGLTCRESTQTRFVPKGRTHSMLPRSAAGRVSGSARYTPERRDDRRGDLPACRRLNSASA